MASGTLIVAESALVRLRDGVRAVQELWDIAEDAAVSGGLSARNFLRATRARRVALKGLLLCLEGGGGKPPERPAVADGLDEPDPFENNN